MSAYVRPALPTRVYLDDDGAPIRYGERWGAGGPPDEAYSHENDLDRFAGLHLVAEALIAWIVESFDVTIDESPAAFEVFARRPDEFVRAVRITPNRADAAPLTIALSRYPGVFVHAGALQDFPFPVCGCDACDESTVGLADELEWTVRCIVHGHFREWIDPEGRVSNGFSLQAEGRGRSGTLYEPPITAEQLQAAQSRLPAGGNWLPYPAR